MTLLPIDPMTPVESPPVSKRTAFLKSFLLTLVLLVVAAGIVQLLHRFGFEAAELILVYTLFVVIISRATPGYFCGVFSAIVSAWAYAFFTIPPAMTFAFSYKFTLTVFIMLLVTLVTSLITAQMKAQTEVAIYREHRAELLFDVNQQLLVTRELGRIVEITNQYLIRYLKRSVAFYLGNPMKDGTSYCTPYPEDATLEAFATRPELRIAAMAYTAQETTGYTTVNPMGSTTIYLPLLYQDRTMAVLGISCKNHGLTAEDQDFLQLLMVQVALALELERLSSEENTARTEAEKEKMRSSLLRAISHDLRTPLTSILGASSTLLESKNLEEKTQRDLIVNIKEGSQWLIRMVENLLSVTRIADNAMALDKTPEAAEEVIAQAISIIRGRFPDASIHVRVPDELLMVPMDATLISQVLINLLENAVKNSHPDELILVNLKQVENTALFEVSDNGTGIPEELLEGLFEMHSIEPVRTADASQGMGIGLSICDTIVRAHGGDIHGRNKESGGALFSFALPLEEVSHGS